MATGRFIISGLFQKKSEQGGGEGVEDMEFPGALKKKHVNPRPRGQLKKKWKF